MKEYMGDGVYAEHLPDSGMIKLTTEDGVKTDNTIYLEGGVWESLVKFVEGIKGK